MTRTFSKLFGLAALRLGWLYAQPHVVDVLHRIRGPFNVSTPAQVAGIAALDDLEHQERARAHNERWLPWLAERLSALGLEVHPSVANFVLVGFDDGARDAAAASAWLEQRGVLARADGGLRATRVSAPVGRSRGREPGGDPGAPGVHGVSADPERPHFRRVALIGIGLINGSLALVLRRDGPRRRDRRLRPHRGDARQGQSARPRRSHDDGAARGGGRRRSRGDRHTGRRLRRGGRSHGAGSRPRHAIVTDVGSIKAEVIRAVVPHLPAPERFVAAHPVAGTEHSGPEAAFATLFERAPLHPDADRGHRSAGGARGRRPVARRRVHGRDHDARAPRPRARDHLASAAPDRLHHRRHRRRSRAAPSGRGPALRRRRLHRLHADRRLRIR